MPRIGQTREDVINNLENANVFGTSANDKLKARVAVIPKVLLVINQNTQEIETIEKFNETRIIDKDTILTFLGTGKSNSGKTGYYYRIESGEHQGKIAILDTRASDALTRPR